MSRLAEEPSIRACAHALILEAMDGINQEVRAGRSFWLARDTVLTAAADGWVARYGKEAADRAVRGLHMLAPGEVLDGETKRITHDAGKAQALRILAAHDPSRDTWLNRLCIGLFGLRLYSLAAVALVACAALQTPSPAHAGSSAAHGDRWRALALCGTLKAGPDRDRACSRFDPAGRRAFRGYDFHGGTPRSWELPRAYELRPYD